MTIPDHIPFLRSRCLRPLSLLALGGLAAAARAQDFNGDHRTDLVVGVPHEDVGGVADAGAVNVYYADASGHIATAGAQVWDQSIPGLGDAPEAGDEFGTAFAWGDLNADGYDDLAIGVPYEDVYAHYVPPGDRVDAGLVHVLFGSPRGLTDQGALRYTEANYWNVELEPGDGFGFSLAIGDVFNSGYGSPADLIVGAPFEEVDGQPAAGAVFTFRSPFDPAGPASQRFTQKSAKNGLAPAAYDRFGWSLAIGWTPWYPWLAIGIPFEDVNRQADAGAVQVYSYDYQLGLLSSKVQQHWTQDSTMIEDQAEAGDTFGYSLATGMYAYDAGWFNALDLAVGVPGEDVNGQADAGAVSMIYFTEYYGQLDWYANQLVTQDLPGMPDPAEAGDAFGSALARVWGIYYTSDQLAIGIPGESFERAPAAGAVLVLSGGSKGMDPGTSSFLHQDAPGMADLAEANDRFGSTLCASLSATGPNFLAIGVPQEDLNGIADCGAVQLWYLTGVNELWHQDLPGAPDDCEAGDHYGLGRAD